MTMSTASYDSNTAHTGGDDLLTLRETVLDLSVMGVEDKGREYQRRARLRSRRKTSLSATEMNPNHKRAVTICLLTWVFSVNLNYIRAIEVDSRQDSTIDVVAGTLQPARTTLLGLRDSARLGQRSFGYLGYDPAPKCVQALQAVRCLYAGHVCTLQAGMKSCTRIRVQKTRSTKNYIIDLFPYNFESDPVTLLTEIIPSTPTITEVAVQSITGTTASAEQARPGSPEIQQVAYTIAGNSDAKIPVDLITKAVANQQCARFETQVAWTEGERIVTMSLLFLSPNAIQPNGTPTLTMGENLSCASDVDTIAGTLGVSKIVTASVTTGSQTCPDTVTDCTEISYTYGGTDMTGYSCIVDLYNNKDFGTIVSFYATVCTDAYY